MTCENKLSKNFIRNCNYKPKAGLAGTVYCINTKEIDKALTQLSPSGMTVSALILAAGAKLYAAEGAGKYPQGTTSMAQGDNGPNWTHGATIRLLYYGDAEREQLKKMVDGGRITLIVEKKDIGLAGELTYDILGFESGMEVSTVEWSSAENEGVVTITLASVEGEGESTDRKIFLETGVDPQTDLEATKAFIETNLYVAA
ncbi:MAG: hypothetical protein ACK5JD_10755 [Mangrovibacterium sp.]